MNYIKIYDAIIERARNRSLSGYVERHHVLPKCLGGDDSEENIVSLTPEEHYLVHLILCKIYPDSHLLSYAAIKMTVNNKYTQRNNKMYAWLKRKHASNISKSQTGKIYYNNGSKSIKLFPWETVPDGFVKGRGWSPTKGLKLSYNSDNFKDSSLQKDLANRRWDKEKQKLAEQFGCETIEEASKILKEFKDKQHPRYWLKPTLKEFKFLTAKKARSLLKY